MLLSLFDLSFVFFVFLGYFEWESKQPNVDDADTLT